MMRDIVEIDQRDRSPAKYWIKFLISRGKHSAEAIEAMLTAIDLGGELEDYIRFLESTMDIPENFQPNNLRHRSSQMFLRREGIYEAWHESASFNEARSILSQGELRALVETYILSPLRPDQAVRKIKHKTGVSISKRAYELFEHYWWNRSLLSGAEWGAFVLERDVAHREWLQLAVEATGSSGAQMILWKTGSMAKPHMEAHKIFKDMRDISYLCFMQSAQRRPSFKHSTMLMNYARTAALAQQQLDASSKAVVDIVEHFNQFTMKREKVETPSVQQLTKGNYSGAEDLSNESKLDDY